MLALLAMVLLASSSAAAAALSPLDVFVVPHSHCDLGWKETFEQYYSSKVRHVLDTTVASVVENPQHRFCFAEIAFFARWWEDQTEDLKTSVRQLLKEGRFEIVNGGWSMSDEACPSYDDAIDQLTLGHRWVTENLQVRPKVAYHIDPFGASSVFPALFAEMCYDAFVFVRVPEQLKEQWRLEQRFEFVWRASRSLRERAEILTHIESGVLYQTLPPFNWELCPPLPEELCPNVTADNVKLMADLLADEFRNAAKDYRHNLLFFSFGGDFEFSDAAVMFDQMDRLIEFINNNTNQYGMTVRYATPHEYFEALHNVSSGLSFPVLGAVDLEPYQFDLGPFLENSWWSGFFTSRPVLKRLIFSSSSLLRSAEFANILHGREKFNDLIEPLKQAMGLALHHDAITGTSTKRVNEDLYTKALVDASVSASSAFVRSLELFLGEDTTIVCDEGDVQDQLRNGKVVPVVVYNTYGWSFPADVVSFEVPRADLSVLDASLKPVPSTVVVSDVRAGSNSFRLSFEAEIVPLGYTTLFVVPAAVRSDLYEELQEDDGGQKNSEEAVEIENEFYALEFLRSTGELESIFSKKLNRTVNTRSFLLRYLTVSDGAYVFRPIEDPPVPVVKAPSLVELAENELYSEVSLSSLDDKYMRRFRLYKSSDPLVGGRIDLSVRIGPIEGNNEVVLRFETDLATRSVLYQSDNNLEVLTRRYNDTLPVAANFYPFTGTAYVQDELSSDSARARLTLLTDYTRGVASLGEGMIEVMLHRRCLQDDECGLEEPMDDTSVMEGRMMLIVDGLEESEDRRQALLPLLRHPLRLAYATAPDLSPADWVSKYPTRDSGIRDALERNVHVLTLQSEVPGDSFLLRLQHIFEEGSHPDYSKEASVNLQSLFPAAVGSLSFGNVTLSASASQKQCAAERMQWTAAGREISAVHVDSDEDCVLFPMQIQTFRVTRG